MSADEAMHKTLEDCYNNNHVLDKYSDEDDDIGSNLSSEREAIDDDHKPGKVKKCMSLGTGLDLRAMAYDYGNDSEDYESWQRSFDDSKDFDTMIAHSECSEANSDLVNNDEESASKMSSNGDEKLSEIDEICDDDDIPDETQHEEGDFRLRRMEKWVSELQNCGSFEETNDNNEGAERDKGFMMLDRTSSSPVPKLDEMVSPGKDAVKKYLSSLSSTATFAQLVNRGLVVIPFLSAFTTLRSLDLRGNAIARITGGSLPRGLHILNLSNNNISTIEGLRQLTRLRVLDLSYNRLLRVGHGLGSCSSLKELYLGGNKIGEVEGLHRLLKLNVLDLRFNKISATKCLRQLSANFNLQAINLEGNPAEKHVGDEHLKKYLQALLPHLVFFNHQPIRGGALNHSADRPARLLAGSGHCMRRGGTRSRGSSSHKLSSSSVYSRKSQSTALQSPSTALPKACKSRRGRVPPKATRRSSHHLHSCEVSKLASFRANMYV
ncbi:dynein assembly factor 1, axonemal-like [Ipomoea triloba]|uniref:dynein assembly factor 1, axonemal-like n=1 Tax=Ipomoea triloba TaxID=35885 RepID=UPI00125CD5B8|nr:dynein assembly factor 1, axonemal-like [Ipomoea triloba]